MELVPATVPDLSLEQLRVESTTAVEGDVVRLTATVINRGADLAWGFEAALVVNDPLPEWDFLDEVEVKVAVAHGLGNAARLIEEIEAGRRAYHFVEIMACPGGCIGGGGQPIPTTQEIVQQRGKALYKIDTKKKYRIATNNPALRKVYDEFLGEPVTKMAEKILHTSYVRRRVKKK